MPRPEETLTVLQRKRLIGLREKPEALIEAQAAAEQILKEISDKGLRMHISPIDSYRYYLDDQHADTREENLWASFDLLHSPKNEGLTSKSLLHRQTRKEILTKLGFSFTTVPPYHLSVPFEKSAPTNPWTEITTGNGTASFCQAPNRELGNVYLIRRIIGILGTKRPLKLSEELVVAEDPSLIGRYYGRGG